MPTTPANLSLTSPIEAVPGVGPKLGEAFRDLGIPSVAHLIDHLPFRHEREHAEASIEDLVLGEVGSARGEVTACRVVAQGRKRFEVVLMDHTGRLDVVWFNQLFLARKITPGMFIRVQGKPAQRGPMLQMVNPRWEPAPPPEDDGGGGGAGGHGDRLRPIYSASEALGTRRIESAVDAVLERALPLLHDHLDEEYREERGLCSLAAAYKMMHHPESLEQVKVAQRRLVYDELLMLQLGVQLRRSQNQTGVMAPALAWTPELDAQIRARIPFTLTEGQESVVADLAKDLARPVPASRLIQGDVGSGKTVVALYAMLLAVYGKHQAAMLAPTALLAEQHYASISRLLEGSKVRVALLTGSIGPQARKEIEQRIADRTVDIVIGTHALLSESVRFQSLAVAIIDEQHRFGVRQRATLRSADEGSQPHTIVMTATPIPRTLALTLFGDLDVSTLKGMPPGRQPIVTEWVNPVNSGKVWGRVRETVERGEQAFIVLPAIGEEGGMFDEESHSTPGALRDVHTTADQLAKGALEGIPMGVVHGRLSPEERERTMEAFRSGEVKVLIATTVIEVGVDVPNATLMVVDHAERFGLAQLHQLRGRVGRGEKPGACILMGEAVTEEAKARLTTMEATTDGFELAEEDLRLRGPGEFFGSRQSGVNPFRFAKFPAHTDLLMLARRDAQDWIAESPELSRPGDALALRRLNRRFGAFLGLIDVG